MLRAAAAEASTTRKCPLKHHRMQVPEKIHPASLRLKPELAVDYSHWSEQWMPEAYEPQYHWT